MTGQELTCKCPEGSCGHHSPQVPSAEIPEPVMVLLEDAWALISVTGDGGDPMRYELGRTLTEWCVWYGGEDPNDCAGLLTYDDEEDAAGHAQWFKGGRVASRTVTRGPWQVRS